MRRWQGSILYSDNLPCQPQELLDRTKTPLEEQDSVIFMLRLIFIPYHHCLDSPQVALAQSISLLLIPACKVNCAQSIGKTKKG